MNLSLRKLIHSFIHSLARCHLFSHYFPNMLHLIGEKLLCLVRHLAFGLFLSFVSGPKKPKKKKLKKIRERAGGAAYSSTRLLSFINKFCFSVLCVVLACIFCS